jgi:hypothetical protein
MDEMLNLVSLRVKCPVCGHSLMDDERFVDNVPSIKLKISCEGHEGIIYLSSVLESYSYLSDIELPDNKIIDLSCPYCNSKLKSKVVCELCNATMIPFDLEVGGRVKICSRVGCQNHFVKFVNFSFALKQLYIDSGFHERPYIEDMKIPKKEDRPKTEEEQHIEIMKTGTFLHSYCPYCKKSLIEDGSIKLKVDREKDTGFLMLSPYLNIFTSRSTIRIPEEEFIGDIKCFHCDKSLILDDMKCEECGSEVARIVVSATRRLVNFHICSKKGCRWHGLSREDLNDIRLEESLEW